MKKRLVIAVLLIVALVFGCFSVAFADADPYVNIVNPSADTTVYSTNLLVSVKVTKQETITVEVAKESTSTVTSAGIDGAVETKTVKNYTNIAEKEKFTSTSNLSYYTKKFENVTPGTYRILVKTLDKDGNVVYSTSRNVKVAEKETTLTTTSTSNQSGTLTFLTNLLKTIFGES